MRAIIASVMLIAVFIAPAYATQASLQDRTRMSISIADYIVDVGKPNPFKTDLVELGAATIEEHWALADWKSSDGKVHGRVLFYHLCDHWNVGKVVTAQGLRARDFVGQGIPGLPSETAAKLVAELSQLENQYLVYLKPAHAGPTC